MTLRRVGHSVIERSEVIPSSFQCHSARGAPKRRGRVENVHMPAILAE
jgi:hypothetical protein